MAPRKAPRTEPDRVSLAFSQSLGKGLAASELLKRLKALHRELADMDQDLIDTPSLDTVAKDLIQPSLLLHKDKGVKAYLACCLVDILRLYAPEAPYTQAELKDLFQFLFRQLKHLTTASEPHFSEYFYVIESLSNVKSIVIVCDLEHSDDLMAELFKQSFDVITSASPKNVQIAVADILSQLLEETTQPSSEVIDTLLAQFLPKNVKTNQAAYLLAVDVCRASADKLQRYVAQYFAEVITSTINGAQNSDGDDSDSASDGPGGGRKGKGAATDVLPSSFVVAHALIKQVNRSVPTLLLNVIPQLEEELRTDRPAYRKLATETLGAMAGEKAGQGDLALKYPSAWKGFLGRSKDKVNSVRIAFVESLPNIWIEHPELATEIEAAVIGLLTDSDDKVRVAACTAIECLDYETTSNHISKTILLALGERSLDARPAVRLVALNTLGHLYDLAFSEIESRDEHAIEHYGWIPGTFCNALWNTQLLTQNLVCAKILEFIVPPPKKDDDEAQWVDRLLLVLQHLNPKQREGLLFLTRLKQARPGPFEGFLKACEVNNGGIIDKEEVKIKAYLKECSRHIAARFATTEQAKIFEDLNKFAKANEKQLYKILRTLLDTQLDLKQQIKSWKECTRRLEQVSPTIVETFLHCLRLNAYLVINRSSISTLLVRVRAPSGPDGEVLATVAVEVLSYISKHRPVLYKTHVAELTKSLGDGSSDQLVTVALNALSRLAKVDRTFKPDKKLSERAKHFARSGAARQAKYAATIVALDVDRPGSADDLVEALADALPDASDDELVPRLAALNRLARYAPAAFENKCEQITIFVLETLHRDKVPGEILDDEEVLWVADEELEDLTKARILAVKILTSRLLGYLGDDKTANGHAGPVFHLLWPLVQAQDEREKYSPPVASRLRLVAALSILKLASTETFASEITAKFDVLARVAQDPCFEVRLAFIDQLTARIRSSTIKSARFTRFNMIFFLVAHDPEAEIIEKAEGFVRGTISRVSQAKRQSDWEHPFLRLIHLLAHHPDFTGSVDDEAEISLMAKYIDMFIRLVVNKDNLPYIYEIALRLKSVADAVSGEYDKALYILSELSQHLLKRVAATNQWPIPTYPGNVPLPGDIFKVLTLSKAQQVRKTNFLSERILDQVAPSGKVVKTKVARIKTEPSVPKKRKSSPKASKTGLKRGAAKKKEAKWNSDSEDESDPESVDDDDSEDDDSEAPAPKKARGPPAPRPESKRASLARGKPALDSSPAAKAKPVKAAQTRGVVKNLLQPREMHVKNQKELSDLSDGAASDEEMA